MHQRSVVRVSSDANRPVFNYDAYAAGLCLSPSHNTGDDNMEIQFALVRALLLHVEAHSRDAWIDLSIDGYSEEAVSDCVRLLDRLGYIVAASASTLRGDIWKSARLTGMGSDLLERARDEIVWTRTMEKAAGKITGCNLTDLKALLDETADEITGDDSDYNAGLQAGRNRMDELKEQYTPAEIEEWLHVMVEHRLTNQQLGTDTQYDAGFIEGAMQRSKEPADPH
jgi:hypothetical protein